MLSGEITGRVDTILSAAQSDGRDMLYEYEVYEILKSVGLDMPAYAVVRDPAEVDDGLLRAFHQAVVVKVISPDIVHKQKVGGVKIVRGVQAARVQKALVQMREDILSHPGEGTAPRIQGFLLVEYIPFTQAIGYETMMGFEQDSAFGPVVVVTKGGDDAEFFAKHYDPANLIMAPFDGDQALQIVNTLNIRYKFESIGHGEYKQYLARAASALSRLAYAYSGIAGDKPRFIINTLDVNPFVIAKDNRFIAVDGYARFTPYQPADDAGGTIRQENLDRFFNPDGIAVVGVSADMHKHSLAREIAHILHDLGRDDLHLVNTGGGSVTFDGKVYELHRSLGEIKANVDLAVYAAPARHTVRFIGELKPNGPKAVVLISGIPPDMKYPDFTAQLDGVLPGNTRVIGPNCIGVFHAPGEGGKGVNTFFVDEKRLEVKSADTSNTALLSQSGALAITLIDKMKHSRLFRAVVSFGNKYDVKITDLVAYFARDERIRVISLYVEGLDRGEGRRLFDLARSVLKPIIVYKTGKTEAGARAAASHTASMAGSYAVFKAACEQAGMVLAEKIEDHQDYTKVFSLLAGKTPGGCRVAGVLNAGFESSVGADELRVLTQARLADATMEKLKGLDPHGLVDLTTSFIDISPMANDQMFAGFVEAAMADEGVDCVFVALVPHTNALKTDPAGCHDSDSLANLLAGLARRSAKPLVVSVNGGSYYQEMITLMEEKGLPVYPDVRSAVKSLDRFVSYHMNKQAPGQ